MGILKHKTGECDELAQYKPVFSSTSRIDHMELCFVMLVRNATLDIIGVMTSLCVGSEHSDLHDECDV